MSDFNDETLVANSDLSTFQYTLQVQSIGNLTDRNLTAGGISAGVLQNKPQSGEAAQVRMFGVSRIKAGGTIVQGAEFTNTVSGTAVAVASGDYAVGQAMTGVASGGIFKGFINHSGWKGQ